MHAVATGRQHRLHFLKNKHDPDAHVFFQLHQRVLRFVVVVVCIVPCRGNCADVVEQLPRILTEHAVWLQRTQRQCVAVPAAPVGQGIGAFTQTLTIARQQRIESDDSVWV